jgi:OOP family OmpA-OmpF porin
MKLKPTGKIVVLILAVGLAFGLWRFWQRFGATIAPPAQTAVSVVPNKADLPATDVGQQGSASGGGANVAMPGATPGSPDKPEVRLLGYAWNAQMGLLFANGGPQATSGSLMSMHGVNLKFSRQDDNTKMQEALTAFATELSQGNANPQRGVHFVTIMGDGGAAFLKPLNDTLRRLGPEYQAKVVGACGFSRGEDKFMGPAEWKSNPTASRGGLVAGVLRDGDWNIAQKWLGDNGLRTNPDERTYDPDALNWVNASDYLDAPQKYIVGYGEDRPVVRNGRRTGETKHVVVNGVVTWTPGDVNVAEKKGGLVSIVSTREYSSQMPCIIIGIDKWMRNNRTTVEGMLQAIADGGEAVKSSPAALQRASAISAQVYHESDAAYWERYYKGVQETDKTGVSVALGGSSVNNLADMLVTFGLVRGSANLFATTYKVFGDIVVSQYPTLVSSYPPADQITDTSYLQAIARKAAPSNTTVAAVTPHYQAQKKVTNVVSRRAWNIHFDTGKATLASDSKHLLEQLSRDALVASGTVLEIHGHTDNQGSPTANMTLSESRAFAVKKWLESKYPVNFPQGRIRVFSHGSENPVAENATSQGRAQNRRVEIVLGTTNQ